LYCAGASEPERCPARCAKTVTEAKLGPTSTSKYSRTKTIGEDGAFLEGAFHTHSAPTPEPPSSNRVNMPPKLKGIDPAAPDPRRNPAEDALARLAVDGNLFKDQVLARLDHNDRASLKMVNRDLRRAVNVSGLQCVFSVSRFVGSLDRFEWMMANGGYGVHRSCPRVFQGETLNLVFARGNMDVIKRLKSAYAESNETYYGDQGIKGHGISVAMFPIAVRHGNKDIVDWLFDGGLSALHTTVWEEAARNAAAGGYLDILKMFASRRGVYPPVYADAGHALRGAMIGGHIDVFKWAYPLIPPRIKKDKSHLYCGNPAITLVVKHGHHEMLKYLFESIDEVRTKILTSKLITAAAAGCGDLEILKWLVDNGSPCDGSACTSAAYGGHLECLRYLVEQKGCKLNERALETVTSKTHLHILRYAIESGCCKWDPGWILRHRILEPWEFGSHVNKLAAEGKLPENFETDLEWIKQRAHQKVADDKLKEEAKEKRAAKKRKAA